VNADLLLGVYIGGTKVATVIARPSGQILKHLSTPTDLSARALGAFSESPTSSGIVVTEGLPCLEMDVLNHLETLAPDDGDYYHNRYLDIDGRLGFNAGSHLKSILGGINAFFPIEDGQIVKGGRQRIYFAEYDGPLARTYVVQVLGTA